MIHVYSTFRFIVQNQYWLNNTYNVHVIFFPEWKIIQPLDILLPNVKLVIKENFVFFPFIALENESKHRGHEQFKMAE